MYRLRPGDPDAVGRNDPPRVQLFGSGSAINAALEAQRTLADDYGVVADVWSVTSYSELRREALATERWNVLHPGESPRTPKVGQLLEGIEGPVVAVSDWMMAVPDQIARWVPNRYHSLGTDGFGLSDTRENLRRHFEIDAPHVVVTALKLLADEGTIEAAVVTRAIGELAVDPERPDPATFNPRA
jgi:pyruvate dehydrogenase E1 component